MRITSGGKVGIGTQNSQNAELAIKSGSNFDLELFSEASGTAWQSYNRTTSTWGYIRLIAGGGEQMRIAANGNVGIGTITPAQKLHVIGNIYSVNSGTDGGQIRLANSGGGSNWYWAARTTGLNLGELGAADGRIFIANGGNVGIGTTSPASKLQVRIGGIGSNANDEVDGVIFEGDRHDLIFKQIRTSASSDWNSTTFRLQTRVDTTLMSSIDFVTDASFERHIDINTASNSLNTRFTHNGKVGIGTNSPSQKLDVNGATNSKGLLINGLHNFGVDSNASIELNNAATSYGVIRAFQSTDATGVIHFFGRSWGGGSSVGMVNIEGHNGVSIGTWNSPSTSTTFLTSGNVGIGTASPSAKLHLAVSSANDDTFHIFNGSVRTHLLGSESTNGVIYLRNSSNSNTVRINTSGNSYFNGGNVGIGNTSPSQKLHVTGSILASSDVVAFSDKKLKENIKTLDGSKVYDMRGVSFTRKDTGKDSSGVIAQEIQKIAPELVTDNDGTLSVAYGNLTGYLIEAVKELKIEIEELKKCNCNCKK